MTSPIEEFLATVARLRSPTGCPWDRKQDHQSLTRYLLEETYEVLEAIHSGSASRLKEELGDLLLQIALHAQIASEARQFDFQDIAKSIDSKMIERHPHVFGDASAADAEDVVRQWEHRKQAEARKNGQSVVDAVPAALPALLKALKVSEKAVAQGFEWRDFPELWQKVESELEELQEALAAEDGPDRKQEIELELGDLLFTLVNVARWQSINPEEALLKAIDKFRHRYRTMEALSQRPLEKLSKDELYEMWQCAKAKTGGCPPR